MTLTDFNFLIREARVKQPTQVFSCLIDSLHYLIEYSEVVGDQQDDFLLCKHNLKHQWLKDVHQCGIDKQVDIIARYLCVLYTMNTTITDMSYGRRNGITITHLIALDTNKGNILQVNEFLHDKTCEYRLYKKTESTHMHHRLIAYLGEYFDDSDDSDIDMMDLEDVEVPPKRKNANELAKREAYLWDHEIAVRAETTGPGIKTRSRFHSHKTPEDIKKICQESKKVNKQSI